MKKRVLSILLAFAMLCMLVPTTVLAADDMHPELAAILNDEGKLELNYIHPDDADDPEMHIDGICCEYNDFRYYEGIEDPSEVGYSYTLTFSEDYSTVIIELYEIGWGDGTYASESGITKIDEQTIEVVWAECDPAVMELVKEKIADFPEDKESFEVTDLELINYGFYYSPTSTNITLAAFSGELKEFFDNKFSFSMRLGAGDGRLFYWSEFGDLKVMYDGIVYHTIPYVGATAKCVTYVPASTGDTSAELAAAVQQKIDGYFGAGKVTVEYDDSYTIADFHEDDISSYDDMAASTQQYIASQMANLESTEDAIESYQTDMTNMQAELDLEYAKGSELWDEGRIESLTDSIAACDEQIQFLEQQKAFYESEIVQLESELENIAIYKESAIAAWEDGGDYDFLADAAGANGEGTQFCLVYEDTGLMFPMVVVKDDAKAAIEMPSCETIDVKTNVQIKTDDISVPLDTTVVAEKLTEGETFNKVVTALEKVEEIADVETSVSYDISLFSAALNDNITKLDNGTFKVTLPIPEGLEGKSLTALAVYYVDDAGKVTEHPIDPNSPEKYVTFETDHFSIYTLAERKAVTGGSGAGEAMPQPEQKPVADSEEVIADTADTTAIAPWMITFCVSTIGCGYVTSKRKEFE